MLKPVENAGLPTRLVDMGVVRVQGADAIKFLQGQVSNDVTRLTAHQSVLAGLHNPQGRAIALLRLVFAGPEEILALVPRELAAAVVMRLGKFVLRAKVKISDASSEWEVAGVQVSGIAGGPAAASVGAARRDEEGRVWVCVATDPVIAPISRTQPQSASMPMAAAHAAAASEHGGSERTGPEHARPEHAVHAGSEHEASSRWLVVSKAAPSAEPRGGEADAALHAGSPIPHLTRDEWHALDIAAGIPQVYAATTEAFVAQMLNLDLIDGIAFDKGCYTGQEVIARAHYRGKVKRRMQRFLTGEPANFRAGDSGTLSDGRTFKVVDAVQRADGRSEFLAVTTFSVGDDASEAHNAEHPAPNADHPGSSVRVTAEQLPLPYSLPA